MSLSPLSSTCANCGAPTTDRYCSACGQPTHFGRLHLHELLHELWHALTHADKGILRLSKELLTQPRQVYLNYFAGQRRNYFSPALYFLLFAGALAVLYPYVFDYEDHVTNRHNEFGRELYHLVKYRSLALLPVQVLLTWVVFRRQYNLSEIIVFWLFCQGFTFLVLLVLLPLYFPLIQHKQVLDDLFSYLAMAIILWHLLALFGRRSWWHRVYLVGMVPTVALLDYLLQGYLLFGSQLWQQPQFSSVGHLLRSALLPY